MFTFVLYFVIQTILDSQDISRMFVDDLWFNFDYGFVIFYKKTLVK